MGKFSSRKKKLIAYAIIASLQMQTLLPVYAAVTPAQGDNAPQVNNNVVNIVAPNANGISHNKFNQLDVDKQGLVFNNHTGADPYASKLAGNINANKNLNGIAATTILNEVVGTNISNLNGFIEIAGRNPANLIIANPNGINVNGAGFINVDRATLVTGRPNFNSGKLGFDVTGGKINVNGVGNAPSESLGNADEANKYLPSKLDIMTRAAAINGELWAKDEINVVTGANSIDYETSKTNTITTTDEKPAVALDVAALGGMYAGKITLVGTEKGLGMNIKGNLSAQGDMTITNDGKITFIKSDTDKDIINPETHKVMGKEGTAISAGGNMTITSTEDVDNQGVITAHGNTVVQVGGTISSSGVLQAGAAYTANDEEEKPNFISDPAILTVTANSINNAKGGQMSASKELNVSSTTTIANDGYMYSGDAAKVNAGGVIKGKGSIGAAKSVNVNADKVTLNKNNIYTLTSDGKIDNKIGVAITEVNPDKPTDPEKPETEDRKPEDFKNPELPDIAGTTKPSETVKQDKVSDDSLGLVADANANGKYKPIIDHAANGVDLVQIAEVNSSGVSRNLYSEFNIKSSGLILNNSTEYTKTELGGYIDHNFFLAGNGARVILNQL